MPTLNKTKSNTKKVTEQANFLHFVIPIRHPKTVKDKAHQKECLTQLLSSMANQSSDNWRAIIVANKGQLLPTLPENVSVVNVNLKATAHEDSTISKEDMFEAVRTDKGSRIAAAMPFVSDASQLMVVDDDDVLHKDLVSFVTSNPTDAFWYIDQGYFWESGSRRVGKMSGLYKLCGTSLILPKLSYAMFSEDDLGNEYIINELGSHKLIFDRFPVASGVWKPIPFRAAIYRVQHENASLTKYAAESRISISSGNAVSRLKGLARGIRRGLRGDPRGGIGLYPITKKLKATFFGSQ